MALAERSAELATLTALAADAARGKGGNAVVCGPVASGKTELLTEFAEHSVENDALLLTALGSPAERTVPFGVVSQLLQGGPFDAGTGARVAELLAEAKADAAGFDPESERVPQVRTHVADELCQLLLGLTRSCSISVIVDDVQHADVPSLQFLLYLAKRSRWERLAVLLGETDQARDVNPLFHAELLRHSHTRRIRLAPLSADGVREVVTGRLGAAATELATAFHPITGGNPLLVRALLEDHGSAAGRPATGRTASPVVGKAFTRAVLSCLHRGDQQCLDVANGVAVLSESCDLELLSELLGLDTALVGHALQKLEAAGLLDALRFRHPAARATVLQELAPVTRAALHGRAAELLHHRGVAVTTVAEQILKADALRAPWAVSALRKAADQALRNDQCELAVRYLERSIRLSRVRRDQVATLVKLTDVVWRINPSTSTRHFAELLTAMRDGLLDAGHARSLLGHLLWHGMVDDAVEVATLMQEQVPAGDVKAAAALAATRQWLSVSYPAVLGRMPSSPVPAPSRDGLPAALGAEPGRRATNALSTVLSTGATGEAVTDAEQVLQCTRLGDATIVPVDTALCTLIYADRLDKAASWCDLLLSEAAGRRTPGWRALLCSVRAEIAFRYGDLRGAESFARKAFGDMTAQSWGVAIGLPLANLVLATTAMGKYDEAAALLDQPLPEALLESRAGLHFLYARGQYNLATDRLYAALADFHACGELMVAWRMDLPALIPWRSALAEVYGRLREPERAKKLAAEQLARCGKRPSRTRGLSLRAVAATQEPRQRPRLLREAEEELQSSGDRLELARVLSDLSSTHQSLGEPSQVRLMARRAWHVANDCHAEPLCQKVMPHRVEEPAAAAASSATLSPAVSDKAKALTEAELRVANLAAFGHTNREIAGKLYITVSTVEQHLTRIYRKLNVSRRKELPTGLQVELPQCRPAEHGRRPADEYARARG
ncbi:helix-turn-helix transcriptional regulator [Amycolatopsis sp. CA-230715]|uniref:helix-turn-helix transcriptional regulator n=1 Tax=Amycolatopsis sp. CA-230715 TaxID=2745196 RepID=UPI001C02AF50|nr:helix-turn-helix transcriptional regulator [Amycolatopsis sp. CA-230715]QWF78533.1 hypothetical protein HUW46_01929 [Amycolatopsis sp. CA-230715]